MPQKKTQPQSHTLIVAAFVGVLLVAAGLFFSQSGSNNLGMLPLQPKTSDANNPAAGILPEVSIPNDWPTYQGDEYAFEYPEGAKIDHGAGGIYNESTRVTQMGPKQIASGRTQTELFDGYSFTVLELGSTSEKTLQEFAAEQHRNSQESCLDGVEVPQPQPVTLSSGLQGFQFEVIGCRVDNVQTFVENKGTAYLLVQSFVGEPVDQAEYRQLTEQILSSFRFL